MSARSIPGLDVTTATPAGTDFVIHVLNDDGTYRKSTVAAFGDAAVEAAVSAATTTTPTSSDFIPWFAASGGGMSKVTISTLQSSVASSSRRVGLPLNGFRISDAINTTLPATPSSNDLGLAAAPGAALVGTTTSGTTANDKATFVFALPVDYNDGGAIAVRVRSRCNPAGFVAAGNLVDVVCKLWGDGALGSDICTTAAQQLTTSYANYDFTITPTGLVAGNVLAIELSAASNDTGGTSNAIASIAACNVQVNVRV